MLTEIKTLDDIVASYGGQEFEVYVKIRGTKLYYAEGKLWKGIRKPITRIDRLISDTYTMLESLLPLDLPEKSYYVYNKDVNKIFSESFIPNWVNMFLAVEPVNLIVTDELKGMSIDAFIDAYVTSLDIFDIIESLIFKQGNKPVFKLKVNEFPVERLPKFYMEIIGYNFFSGDLEEIHKFYNSPEDMLLSVANQLIIRRYNENIDIDIEMVPYKYMKVYNIGSKMHGMNNSIVIDMINNNKNLYYVYVLIILILTSKNFDSYFRDPGILKNIAAYREIIKEAGTPPLGMITFDAFNICKV
jgi:hypothetical protein